MWPSITYETREWIRDEDELAVIPKSRRRKILPTYQAALPARIADAAVELPVELNRRIVEIEVTLARFDQAQASRGFELPAILLRSESASSSQIERLTSSARNIALAELSDKAPTNAVLIAKNINAMRTAVEQNGELNINSICAIHDVLMRNTDASSGVRTEQVWIGGHPYSPHGATFIPPHASKVKGALSDLLSFAQRNDISAVAKAAIFHAQFESIHPFTDGNGRTGRALIHRMLSNDEALLNAMLPISAGLLHDIERYKKALDAYHDGAIEPVVECMADALELAVVIGSRIASDVEQVLERWATANGDRTGSASHRLPGF